MADGPVKTALTELLGQIRDGKEIRTYLDRFGAAGGTSFAIFKLGGAVLRDDLETVAAGLALLNTVGLTPIVVHGAGPQLDEAIAAAGVDAGKKDGLRVSTPEVMDVVSTIAMRTTIALSSAIGQQGGHTAAVPPAAIRARIVDEEKYGRVGDPLAVDLETISAITDSGSIPLISNIGVDEAGRLVNINADAVARALALAFEPLKIVFVTGTGGLLDNEGDLITSINLNAELEQMIKDGTVHSGMQLKLEEIGKLLSELPPSTSVSITSPDGIVRELFTHGGQGTLVRLGEQYERHETIEDVDVPRLKRLIERAFGKTLPAGYLESLPIHRIYVSEGYRTAAVLIKLGDAVLLDKFVVDPDARGEGLTHGLWRLMIEDEPVVYWRSRQTNGFNGFYMSHADGFVRRGIWNIFWTGRPGLGEAASIIEDVVARTPSFIEDAS
ncbi:acetylglutamate kinase [Parvularcula marina]|uniref:Acetylglutamate kinase n=1 Tax=Parvularcula marina TaxID=2292771 RepID=A0A371REY9_9PROT|nr:acetylglutamate kinase [Parvularcula marina]RFB04016.1 acetylglutamate kinase [Parvularcula marina]